MPERVTARVDQASRGDGGARYPLDHGRGYAPIPRDVASLEALMQDHAAAMVWLLIYLRVRHEAGWARGSHGPVWLDRGQCVAGVREIAEQLGLGKNAVHRALRDLERLGLIARNAGQLGSVVTVVAYGTFGDGDDSTRDSARIAPGQRQDGPGTASGQPEDTAGHSLGTVPDPKERENGGKGKRRKGEKGASDVAGDADGATVHGEEPPEALQLADELRDAIAGRQPGTREIQRDRWPRTRARWARAFRLAHTADRRSWDDLRRVLAWSQADPFWAGNILSGDTFKAKFDRLAAQMGRSPRGAGGDVRIGRVEPHDRAAYDLEAARLASGESEF